MFRCLVGWSGECGGAVDGAGAGAVCAGKEGKEMKQRGAAQRSERRMQMALTTGVRCGEGRDEKAEKQQVTGDRSF